MEQIYTLFPVLSSDKFNVSNFTKKMSYIFTAWPAQRVCIFCILWMAQSTSKHSTGRVAVIFKSCYFQNLVFYTLLCSFFAVFAVWLVCALKELQAPKHHAQMYTESEYSQLAQLDSGLVLPCIATIVQIVHLLNNGLPISISWHCLVSSLNLAHRWSLKMETSRYEFIGNITVVHKQMFRQ